MFKIGESEQERSFEFSVESINISHIWGNVNYGKQSEQRT